MMNTVINTLLEIRAQEVSKERMEVCMKKTICVLDYNVLGRRTRKKKYGQFIPCQFAKSVHFNNTKALRQDHTLPQIQRGRDNTGSVVCGIP